MSARCFTSVPVSTHQRALHTIRVRLPTMCPPCSSVLSAYHLTMASDELWMAADGNFDEVVPVSAVGAS